MKDVSARLTWVLPYLTLTSSLQGSLIPSFQLNHSHPWIHPSVRPSLVQPLLSFVVNEGPPAPLPSSPFSPSTGPSSYHFSPPTPTAHDATLQCFLFNCLQPSVPLFSIMPFQQLPPHFDQFSGLCSLHRDTPQSLRTDEGCLIWAVTLTLVHHPQTFLPAFLRSFSHFLLSFSKNPWIPPNSHFLSFFFFFSHFLLTGDLFLLFSEGKKKPAFSQGPPLNPQTSVSSSALQFLVAHLSWIPVPPTFSSKHHLFSFRLLDLSSSTVFPASFKRLQVSLFIKNPNKPLLQPLTPIIFQLTISLWASFSLQPTFDSIIPLTQLSEAADPHYSSASSCSPPFNTGNWGPLLPS